MLLWSLSSDCPIYPWLHSERRLWISRERGFDKKAESVRDIAHLALPQKAVFWGAFPCSYFMS